MYGKQTECAIASLSVLAEAHGNVAGTRVLATEIADARGLPRPFVAKILSALAQAGLVTGSRGPGGGFSLSMPPGDISLGDVVRIFERENASDLCPFGGGRCGVDEPCPLHDRLVAVKEAMDGFLEDTTFDIFVTARREKKRRAKRTPVKGKRSSYRAPKRR